MHLHHLEHDGLHVAVDISGHVPRVVHWGAPVGRTETAVDELVGIPRAPASLDRHAPLDVVPTAATGFTGRPGIECHRPGRPLMLVFDEGAVDVDDRSISFRSLDTDHGVELRGRLALEDVLVVDLSITNLGEEPLAVDHLAPTLPLPDAADEVLRLTGQWCAEFQLLRMPWAAGIHLIETRRGRTGHDSVPVAFAGQAGFGEHHGVVHGVHLAWSGNHATRLERLPDGRRFVQSGALLAAGEIVLEPGSSFASPRLLAAVGTGTTQCSRRFHRQVRRLLPSTPRPVLLNTWEAVYFDHDVDTLCRLADRAAEVGVERFVLDDGWFGGRRDDTAGLGDWWVSPDAHPDGLGPIIEHVTGLGMEFGLWVEPEMVNPDSDLFRSHPEWVLGDAGLTGRNQLVLDLDDDDCRHHLFGALDRLLTDHDISFLKWDMNRDVIAPGTFAQTRALYRLMDDLRARHPSVEVESCASGGGRADAGILERTARIWTSDCNDPLERQRIQRGFSHFLPPEVMGSHIGPPRAHTTGRTHRLAFRAATAIFGHLGIEWNLLDATDRDLSKLQAWVALHKELRPLLHAGDVVRLDPPDEASLAHGVVARDSSTALFSYAQLTTSPTPTPPRLMLAGIDADRNYLVTRVAMPGEVLGLTYEQPGWLGPEGVRANGHELRTLGLQMPRLFPETAILIRLDSA